MTKRILAILSIVVLLIAIFPVQTFAVDPVSTTVMANAFAQAVAAYGASQGVAMTFDVSSTDGIGESVHELWKQFRSGQQTADDYDTLAAALFPNLYSKFVNAGGRALVALNIAQSLVPDLDDFYNWLLSGPAEMVKVDNQYQFSSSQIGSSAIPIEVLNLDLGTFSNSKVPVLATSSTAKQIYNAGVLVMTFSDDLNYKVKVVSSVSGVYWCYVGDSIRSLSLSSHSFVGAQGYSGNPSKTSVYNSGSVNYNGVTIYRTENLVNSGSAVKIGLKYSSDNAAYAAFLNYINNPNTVDIGVKAYDNDGIAEFPDTSDPNYDAVAKQIPTTTPWDNDTFGDGEGAITDAQSTAIEQTISDAIEADTVIELSIDEEIDVPTIGEVYVPFLPVALPNFNFSLAGIWHYVRDFVTSISAWLSMTLSVWGILPYALYLPVYATAVIMIVFGVYKRFFM